MTIDQIKADLRRAGLTLTVRQDRRQRRWFAYVKSIKGYIGAWGASYTPGKAAEEALKKYYEEFPIKDTLEPITADDLRRLNDGDKDRVMRGIYVKYQGRIVPFDQTPLGKKSRHGRYRPGEGATPTGSGATQGHPTLPVIPGAFLGGNLR